MGNTKRTIKGGTKCTSTLLKNRLAQLENLVEELVKDNPDPAIIEPMMLELGLPFKNDPIFQLNTVLQALHGAGSGTNEGRGQNVNLQ